MRTKTKRLVSLLLVLVMCLSISCSVFAATPESVGKYSTYLCLGDSVASGFGQPQYNAYGELVHMWDRIEGSYPDVLAKYVHADTMYPYAVPGLSSQTLRYLFDDTYDGGHLLNTSQIDNLTAGAFNKEILNEWRPKFREAAAKADLITVDRQYETAIETALGGRIQNIVTDSEETAKRLIEHLKRNRYGRATFLPLTSAGNAKRWEPGPVMQEEGVIGIAADLVHTEPRYEGLIRSLLGRDIVVRDIDRAIAIERKYHYSFRIVTPEGELLNPGGSMSGGAYKNSSNLLGRKREIEELEASVEKILKQADRTQAELDQANMVHEEVKAEIEALRGEEQTLLLEKNTEEMALARLTEKREELEDSLNDLASERIQLKQQTDEINDSRRSLNTDIAGI